MLDCPCFYPALHCGSVRDHVFPSLWIHFFAAFCSFLFFFSCCLHLTPPDHSVFFRFLTTLPHLVNKCRPEISFLSMVRVFCHDEPRYALTLWRHKPNLIYCQQQQWGSQPARRSRLITLRLVLTLLVCSGIVSPSLTQINVLFFSLCEVAKTKREKRCWPFNSFRGWWNTDTIVLQIITQM